jgi:hypothetical protein
LFVNYFLEGIQHGEAILDVNLVGHFHCVVVILARADGADQLAKELVNVGLGSACRK